jgi:hypothetical protein
MANWPEFVTAIFGGVGGSFITAYGLSRWLGDVWRAKILEKVQQANRKELETLRSEMQASIEKANRVLDAGISKAIMVTRTHFETEFAAYKEIFAALSDLKNCIHATRPIFIIAGEEEQVKDTKNLVERLNRLIAANNKAVVVSENLKPFYPDEIFQAVQKCFNSSKLEALQVKTGSGETFSEEWFDQGRLCQEEFMQDYIVVSELIRERLDSLGVMPE